ncbi:MAG: selenide, water dikinase SelD [Syntrophales bacterium]|jgi:selenide,water dikinase|nr:selenide, water dikinase SelD [Syntrophales bacterium]MCK9391587.1 selenide, water dikinase SelD [Syntrophales bacterium]
MTDPNLLTGMEHSEDAGVYKLRDDLAIIQTVDFFTPIVDDPYTFGQIAVTNALSDVYAMGGKPLTAMNIVCFPIKKLDVSILRDILRGGLDKMREAGVLLVGGHSVEDDETKYGLAVTGVIHPDQVLMNRGARPGDKLILTKALGTGIVSTAAKAGAAPADLIAKSIAAMTTLNKGAAEILMETPDVHACTDVTGFGLLGHACEMIEDSDVGIHIFAAAVPFFEGLQELAEMGILPEGLHRNRQFHMSRIEVSPDCPEWLVDILFDPQTAGGLLLSVAPEQAIGLLDKFHRSGLKNATIVGEVTGIKKGEIIVSL